MNTQNSHIPGPVQLGIALVLLLLPATIAFGGTRKVIAKTAADVPASSKAPATKTAAKPKAPVRRKTPRRASNVRKFVSKPAAPKGSLFDPTVGDNSSGEDLVVRQAAIDAIGTVNGSMVAVDPSSGRILSIVNQKMALESGYQPCSTFKPAVALAALQEGVITDDKSRLRLGKRLYLTLQESLARSNNAYFAKLGSILGLEKMRTYAEKFGFSEPAGWGLENEAPGTFPTEPPPVRDGGVGKVASFGQGINQTPLQLVSFMSAVANGGTLYYLQRPTSAEEIESFQPRIKRDLEIEQWLAPVREGMADAVLFGTAKRAHQPDVPVLGKTGTCSQNGMKLAWFAGYSESPGGIAVAVLLRTLQPMGGGPHAAELAGKFFRKLADEKYAIRPVEKPLQTDAPAALPASIQLVR
jgi:penicillin-binding protein 2